MSKASRNRIKREIQSAVSTQLALAPSAQLAAPDLTPSAFGGYGGGGYQGAGFSTQRGYIYWPSMDPKREIDTYSRNEIARKVHWLCANVGLPRRIIVGLTNLIVGNGLRPQALTSDTEWNELAEKAYNRRGNSPLSFSTTGRFTSVQAQRLMVKTRLKDGDGAVVFSKSENGGALRSFYSGIQIGNAVGTKLDQSKWRDGLFLDSLERVQAYRFPREGGAFTDIPATAVRFLCRYDSPGQIRGMSCLAHAVNKMIDLTEVNSFVMAGIKASNQIGYYLTQSGEQGPRKMGGNLGGKTAQVQTPAGPLTLKLVYGQGGEIPSLPKGMDLKTLLDQRPHPNSREYCEDVIRDISWGTDVSSDLLWNIYKLGGANVRYVLADAQVFVQSEQQDLVDTWLSADWAYAIACEMQAGRLRRCNDPEWWKHGWIPPSRMTVDFGRDGRIYMDMWKAGLLTTSRFFGMAGQDAREELGGELAIIAWHKAEMEKLKLSWDDIKSYRGVNANPTLQLVDPNGAPVEIPDDEEEIEEPTQP